MTINKEILPFLHHQNIQTNTSYLYKPYQQHFFQNEHSWKFFKWINLNRKKHERKKKKSFCHKIWNQVFKIETNVNKWALSLWWIFKRFFRNFKKFDKVSSEFVTTSIAFQFAHTSAQDRIIRIFKGW